MICKWFIECHEMPIRSRWLRMALLMNQIEGYSIADYQRLNHAEFSGRTWDWVDPLKDIKTAVAEVQLGITSRQEICRKKGKSFEKIVAQNEVDIALLESAGLPSDPTGAPKLAPPVTNAE
jgi:capsid protein